MLYLCCIVEEPIETLYCNLLNSSKVSSDMIYIHMYVCYSLERIKGTPSLCLVLRKLCNFHFGAGVLYRMEATALCIPLLVGIG